MSKEDTILIINDVEVAVDAVEVAEVPSEAAVEVVEAPVEVVDVVEAPVEVVEASVDVVDTPVEVVEAPVEVAEAPSEVPVEVPIKELKMSVIDPGPKFGYPEDDLTNNKENTLGLEDELSPSDKEECHQRAITVLEQRDLYNEDLNLDTDSVQQSGQNYAVVSFIGPTFTAKSDIYALRIMGAFDTVEEATNHIGDLTEKEKMFDTGIVELYKFVPSYPAENDDQKSVDKFLNDIIVNYKIEREEAKQLYEKRKEKLMANKQRIIEKDRVEAPQPQPQLTDPQQLTDNPQQPLQQQPSQSRSQSVEESMKTKLSMKKQQQSSNINVKNVTTKIEGQNFVAITYVGNTGNNNRTAIKIKGIFNTYEECSNFAKDCVELDNTYDILVAEMYAWLQCDPNVDQINQVHNDPALNKLFKAHEDEKKKAEKLHYEKKQFVHTDAKYSVVKDGGSVNVGASGSVSRNISSSGIEHLTEDNVASLLKDTDEIKPGDMLDLLVNDIVRIKEI